MCMCVHVHVYVYVCVCVCVCVCVRLCVCEDTYKYIGAHSAKKIERPASDKTSVERPAEHDTSNHYSGTLLALLVQKYLLC